MPAYEKGDRVAAKEDFKRGSKVITKGTKGRVTKDSPADIVIVRVKFSGDPNAAFRIAPKVLVEKI